MFVRASGRGWRQCVRTSHRLSSIFCLSTNVAVSSNSLSWTGKTRFRPGIPAGKPTPCSCIACVASPLLCFLCVVYLALFALPPRSFQRHRQMPLPAFESVRPRTCVEALRPSVPSRFSVLNHTACLDSATRHVSACSGFRAVRAIAMPFTASTQQRQK